MSTFLVFVGLLILGVLVNLAAFVWTCVVARRHTAWWLLAFFLVPLVQGAIARYVLGPEALSALLWVNILLSVPFARLAFAGRHWADARKPMVLTAVGLAMIWVPLGFYRREFVASALQFAQTKVAARPKKPPDGRARPGTDPAPTVSEAMQRETAAVEAAEQRQRQLKATQAAYNQHRAGAETLFKDLDARRAKLKPGDAPAVAAFNADAARYAALLEQAKSERAALDSAASAAPPEPPAVPVSLSVTAPPVGNNNAKPPAAVVVAAASPAPASSPVSAPVEASPGLYRRSLDRARSVRDAASRQTAEAQR